MIMNKSELKAPFVYFGGKAKAASEVWRRFGDVRNSIEPFFGSGAVLLKRPLPFQGYETVNDLDGMVVNFWRSIRKDPDLVAKYADWPSFENDKNARHAWLVGKKKSLRAKLEGDPEYCNPKIAGWWVWGISVWIGSGFCSGNGPWRVVDGRLIKTGEKGDISRQIIYLGGPRGIMTTEKAGIRRCKSRSEDVGCRVTDRDGMIAWFKKLQDRFRNVRIACGGWERVCGGKSGESIDCFFAGGGNKCGIFLDPPYSDVANRESKIYVNDSLSVAHDVREWCKKWGGDKRFRIALCGYDVEHQELESLGWSVHRWKATGGWSSLSKKEGGSQAKKNAKRECIWFSPHCIEGVDTTLGFYGGDPNMWNRKVEEDSK